MIHLYYRHMMCIPQRAFFWADFQGTVDIIVHLVHHVWPGHQAPWQLNKPTDDFIPALRKKY